MDLILTSGIENVHLTHVTFQCRNNTDLSCNASTRIYPSFATSFRTRDVSYVHSSRSCTQRNSKWSLMTYRAEWK
ncbi:hypothetical protein PUN28_004733 [Cardiocondyla obscurior]|uniref:Uncharacterized protein n=1 Tax=Cardiocondyla obscurior TaxID=286306 RepID=A0AAW2GEA5_9HYME